MEQFKADLTVPLTYYEVYQCLVLVDKAVVAQACPIDLDQIVYEGDELVVCSKCHTQISRLSTASTTT